MADYLEEISLGVAKQQMLDNFIGLQVCVMDSLMCSDKEYVLYLNSLLDTMFHHITENFDEE